MTAMAQLHSEPQRNPEVLHRNANVVELASYRQKKSEREASQTFQKQAINVLNVFSVRLTSQYSQQPELERLRSLERVCDTVGYNVLRPELEALRSLSPNWNGHGAQVPNTVAFKNAHYCLQQAMHYRILPERIAPSTSGGIALMYFGGSIRAGGARSRHAFLECTNDGDLYIVLMDWEQENNNDVSEVDLTSTLENDLRRIDQFCR